MQPFNGSRLDRRRVLIVVIAVLMAISISILIFDRFATASARKVYGETATVVEKNWDFVERRTYILIPAGGISAPKKDCKATSVQRFKVLTSVGSKYEIELMEDWQMIEKNDVVLEFNWSDPELNSKTTKPRLTSWTEIPPNPCWLEIWRNGAFLKDVKAYKIMD